MRKNPIERRIECLSDQWYAFASAPHARLLCWRFPAGDLGMADAFFATEADERTAEHADVFVPLDVPFAEPRRHGFALATALAQGYRQHHEEPDPCAGTSPWTAPRTRPGERDLAFLLRTCSSLRAHHGLEGKLVLVLRPQRVAKPAVYRSWLLAFAEAAPDGLRAVVLDDLEHPAHAELVDPRRQAVVAVAAQLDMQGALQELSNAAGDLDTPGGQLRDLVVQLANRLGRRDLPGALQLGDRALAVVAEHRLGLLAVPIHVALGSGLLAERRVEEALAQFEAAESVAVQAEREGPPAATGASGALRLQSRLAFASALLSAERFACAAEHCEQTAPVARALGDARAELDCHRLACFAWARAGQRPAALRAGRAGLEVGRAMDPDTRASSTFDSLAAELLALTAGARDGELRAQVASAIDALRATPREGERCRAG